MIWFFIALLKVVYALQVTIDKETLIREKSDTLQVLFEILEPSHTNVIPLARILAIPDYKFDEKWLDTQLAEEEIEKWLDACAEAPDLFSRLIPVNMLASLSRHASFLTKIADNLSKYRGFVLGEFSVLNQAEESLWRGIAKRVKENDFVMMRDFGWCAVEYEELNVFDVDYWDAFSSGCLQQMCYDTHLIIRTVGEPLEVILKFLRLVFVATLSSRLEPLELNIAEVVAWEIHDNIKSYDGGSHEGLIRSIYRCWLTKERHVLYESLENTYTQMKNFIMEHTPKGSRIQSSFYIDLLLAGASKGIKCGPLLTDVKLLISENSEFYKTTVFTADLKLLKGILETECGAKGGRIFSSPGWKDLESFYIDLIPQEELPFERRLQRWQYMFRKKFSIELWSEYEENKESLTDFLVRGEAKPSVMVFADPNFTDTLNSHVDIVQGELIASLSIVESLTEWCSIIISAMANNVKLPERFVSSVLYYLFGRLDGKLLGSDALKDKIMTKRYWLRERFSLNAFNHQELLDHLSVKQ